MLLKSKLWIACLPVVAALQARAAWGDDQLSYVHETYIEHGGRMEVNTESGIFRATLSPYVTLSGSGVYDSISGATPIGAPAPNQLKLFDPITHARIPNSMITGFTRSTVDAVSGASPTPGGASGQAISRTAIPTAESRDYRTAFSIAADLSFGNQRLTPQLNYSKESDYISYTGALNYAIDLNEKNTTLNIGWSHADDLILSNGGTFITTHQIKNTDNFVLGFTQLLSPRTILTMDVTEEYAHGYLNDPYRAVVFDESVMQSGGLVPLYGEKRPTTRNGQSLFVELTQAIEPLHASVQGSYRYYRDSYAIQSHTVELAWFQKFGRSFVVSPSFRYYFQEGASFYGTQFPGDPVADPARVPSFYSSDYRLSHFAAYTIGLDATYKLNDTVDFRLGYKRYIMRGLDRTTSQSVYPSADILAGGFDITF